ncbi:hypothetical protein TGCAST_299130B, partial [Toxoplasma gondii CAST]
MFHLSGNLRRGLSIATASSPPLLSLRDDPLRLQHDSLTSFACSVVSAIHSLLSRLEQARPFEVCGSSPSSVLKVERASEARQLQRLWEGLSLVVQFIPSFTEDRLLLPLFSLMEREGDLFLPRIWQGNVWATLCSPVSSSCSPSSSCASLQGLSLPCESFLSSLFHLFASLHDLPSLLSRLRAWLSVSESSATVSEEAGFLAMKRNVRTEKEAAGVAGNACAQQLLRSLAELQREGGEQLEQKQNEEKGNCRSVRRPGAHTASKRLFSGAFLLSSAVLNQVQSLAKNVLPAQLALTASHFLALVTATEEAFLADAAAACDEASDAGKALVRHRAKDSPGEKAKRKRERTGAASEVETALAAGQEDSLVASRDEGGAASGRDKDRVSVCVARLLLAAFLRGLQDLRLAGAHRHQLALRNLEAVHPALLAFWRKAAAAAFSSELAGACTQLRGLDVESSASRGSEKLPHLRPSGGVEQLWVTAENALLLALGGVALLLKAYEVQGQSLEEGGEAGGERRASNGELPEDARDKGTDGDEDERDAGEASLVLPAPPSGADRGKETLRAQRSLEVELERRLLRLAGELERNTGADASERTVEAQHGKKIKGVGEKRITREALPPASTVAVAFSSSDVTSPTLHAVQAGLVYLLLADKRETASSFASFCGGFSEDALKGRGDGDRRRVAFLLLRCLASRERRVRANGGALLSSPRAGDTDGDSLLLSHLPLLLRALGSRCDSFGVVPSISRVTIVSGVSSASPCLFEATGGRRGDLTAAGEWLGAAQAVLALWCQAERRKEADGHGEFPAAALKAVLDIQAFQPFLLLALAEQLRETRERFASLHARNLAELLEAAGSERDEMEERKIKKKKKKEGRTETPREIEEEENTEEPGAGCTGDLLPGTEESASANAKTPDGSMCGVLRNAEADLLLRVRFFLDLPPLYVSLALKLPPGLAESEVSFESQEGKKEAEEALPLLRVQRELWLSLLVVLQIHHAHFDSCDRCSFSSLSEATALWRHSNFRSASSPFSFSPEAPEAPVPRGAFPSLELLLLRSLARAATSGSQVHAADSLAVLLTTPCDPRRIVSPSPPLSSPSSSCLRLPRGADCCLGAGALVDGFLRLLETVCEHDRTFAAFLEQGEDETHAQLGEALGDLIWAVSGTTASPRAAEDEGDRRARKKEKKQRREREPSRRCEGRSAAEVLLLHLCSSVLDVAALSEGESPAHSAKREKREKKAKKTSERLWGEPGDTETSEGLEERLHRRRGTVEAAAAFVAQHLTSSSPFAVKGKLPHFSSSSKSDSLSSSASAFSTSFSSGALMSVSRSLVLIACIRQLASQVAAWGEAKGEKAPRRKASLSNNSVRREGEAAEAAGGAKQSSTGEEGRQRCSHLVVRFLNVVARRLTPHALLRCMLRHHTALCASQPLARPRDKPAVEEEEVSSKCKREKKLDCERSENKFDHDKREELMKTHSGLSLWTLGLASRILSLLTWFLHPSALSSVEVAQTEERRPPDEKEEEERQRAAAALAAFASLNAEEGEEEAAEEPEEDGCSRAGAGADPRRSDDSKEMNSACEQRPSPSDISSFLSFLGDCFRLLRSRENHAREDRDDVVLRWSFLRLSPASPAISLPFQGSSSLRRMSLPASGFPRACASQTAEGMQNGEACKQTLAQLAVRVSENITRHALSQVLLFFSSLWGSAARRPRAWRDAKKKVEMKAECRGEDRDFAADDAEDAEGEEENCVVTKDETSQHDAQWLRQTHQLVDLLLQVTAQETTELTVSSASSPNATSLHARDGTRREEAGERDGGDVRRRGGDNHTKRIQLREPPAVRCWRALMQDLPAPLLLQILCHLQQVAASAVASLSPASSAGNGPVSRLLASAQAATVAEALVSLLSERQELIRCLRHTFFRSPSASSVSSLSSRRAPPLVDLLCLTLQTLQAAFACVPRGDFRACVRWEGLGEPAEREGNQSRGDAGDSETAVSFGFQRDSFNRCDEHQLAIQQRFCRRLGQAACALAGATIFLAAEAK